jgi:hypothetical protein
MPLPKLNIAPEKTSFTAQAGEAVLRQVVIGGHARTRRDQLGAPLTIRVSWLASVTEFAYLGAFYRSLINHGSEPFLIDLVVGYAMPIECEARFLPGSFSLGSISGLTHVCQATLEVVAPVRDAGADAALVAARAAPVDGLPVMALTPSISGYSIERADTVIRSEPGMGPSAQRLDRFNSPSRMSAHWNVGPSNFEYLAAFYWTTIAEGALPFLIEAVLDRPDARYLKAKLVPGSFQNARINGLTYGVSAEIDVVPVLSPSYDSTVLALFDADGEEWADFFGGLETLVNVDLPTWD